MTGHITRDGLASLALRLGLAMIFLFHGTLKVAYDPSGWHKSLPAAVQVAVSFGELLCGLAMLIGLFSRVAAVGLIAIMIGAIMEVGHVGFAQLDIDKAKGATERIAFGIIVPGIEYNIAIITMAVAVLFMGSGPLSLDYRLTRRGPAPAASASGASDQPGAAAPAATGSS